MDGHSWLLKTEPSEYGIDDLERDGETAWTGIRNFRARNYLRDRTAPRDRVVIYHSSVRPAAAAGVGRIVSKPFPDPTQSDPSSPYYDSGAKDGTRWVAVTVAFEARFPHPVTIDAIRADRALRGMMLLERGAARLSVQPVTAAQFRRLCALGGLGPDA